MEQTGNQTQNTSVSPLSGLDNDKLGKLTTGLHAIALEQNEIETIMAAVRAAKEIADNRPSEMEVMEWEPLPALLSDREFTFATGTSEARTVRLKILPGEYYVTQLLPWIAEWTAAIYRDDSLNVLQASSQNPLGFMYKLFKAILDRPRNDRVKISFYQACSATFSTPEQIITPEFFAICPPDEQMGSIMRLVETNRGNFTRFWADAPTLLKRELTLLYMTIIESIQQVNASVISSIKRMTTEIQQFHLNGGVPDIGPDGSGAWPTTSPASTKPS